MGEGVNLFGVSSAMDSFPWGMVFLGVFIFNLWMFALTRELRHLCSVVVAGAVVGVWTSRDSFGWHWLLVPAATVAALIVISWRMDSEAQKHVPTVNLKPNEDGLLPLVYWLRDVRAGVPSNISAAVQRIADHVSALDALRVEMPSAQLPLDQVRFLVGKDLRDLVVRWKRVETATKMLPGKQTLGVDALAGGFGRIECALVAIREDVASAALNDLKVSERYLELKHGEGV